LLEFRQWLAQRRDIMGLYRTWRLILTVYLTAIYDLSQKTSV